ncbi:MAG: aldehyde ferredoxin oxidoreductase family protein [Anaerolineaceae bacterium]|jgi:aldehyde:ferredoxin oxidoreductase|nr:aldehyde ferredoxin oxidoreductase family protein [Anaerolineaceae bacterium]
MPFGYNGKIAHINLSTKEILIETPPEDFYRKYIGGQAMSLYYLLKQVPPKINAFDEKNVLVIALSVTTGAPISGQSRVVVSSKSPLTGGIGTSEAGGFWPAEAKATGFDAFVIGGKASTPVYIYVHDEIIEIIDAYDIWGLKTKESEAKIRENINDPKLQILQIGPAGEKLVRFAAIMNMSNRANGRTGMGAVMGSKNLKAIAVRGKKKIEISNPEALKKLSRWGAENLKTSAAIFTAEFGTASATGSLQARGGLVTRNWTSGVYEHFEDLTGKKMSETILKKRDTCFACILRCKRVVQIDGPDVYVDPHYGGPEFETIALFGSACEIHDLRSIALVNQICNAYGIDTITTGGIAAWLMELFDLGIINTKDTDGFEIRFGDANAIIKLAKMIGKREGFGDQLAEGMNFLAEKFGPKAKSLTTSVKNNVMPAHMPQIKKSLALIYAVNPYGADHESTEHDGSYLGFPKRMEELGLTNPQPPDVLNEEKVRYTLIMEQFFSFLNSINICLFVWGPGWQLYGPGQTMEMVNAITGWNMDLTEALRIGERSINMMRMFNVREGFSRKDDLLPEKIHIPLKGGVSDGFLITREELEEAISKYYSLSEWDQEGVPQRTKLIGLELDWINM